MLIFPEKNNYPDSFSILDMPDKDIKHYTRMVVSSAFAYFDSDPITKYLFKKRFYLIDKYIKKNVTNKFKKALDVGTGIGFFLPTLSSYATDVVALDYSEDILDYVNFMIKDRDLANISTVRGDITKLPFADDSFDLIVCMSVLEHFNPLDKPFLELKRVLAHGGLLIIGYPSETAFFRFLHQKVLGFTTSKGKIAKKILDAEQSDDTLHISHVSNSMDMARIIKSSDFQDKGSSSIKIFPPFFELYRINFLKKK